MSGPRRGCNEPPLCPPNPPADTVFPAGAAANVQQSCCNTTTEDGYFTNPPTNTQTGCCDKSEWSAPTSADKAGCAAD